jgi:hypothetical protein
MQGPHRRRRLSTAGRDRLASLPGPIMVNAAVLARLSGTTSGGQDNVLSDLH